MNPFFFGAGQSRLFGVYEPPCADRQGVRAALLCYPWGAEYLYAHRAMRQLARRLTAAGFHTLRFDYFGTGDSAGDAHDGDLTIWQANVESAMDELKDITGAGRVTLVGLRLGAALAAMVAAQRPDDVEALVLWDPIVCGKEYLEHLEIVSKSNNRSGGSSRSLPIFQNGECEIDGFVLTPKLISQLTALNIEKLLNSLELSAFVLYCEPVSSSAGARERLAQRARAPVAIEHIADVEPWIERPMDSGAIPVKALERIVEWLAM